MDTFYRNYEDEVIYTIYPQCDEEEREDDTVSFKVCTTNIPKKTKARPIRIKNKYLVSMYAYMDRDD